MMQETNQSMVMGNPDLPPSGSVCHPMTLAINSESVLLFCATAVVVSLAVTNRKVAWLSRAALVGVIGYAFYEQRQLDKMQVEWFRLDDPRRNVYLCKHLATWTERIDQPDDVEEEWGELKEVAGLREVPLWESVKNFVLPKKDPDQMAYEEAWWTQMGVLEPRLSQGVIENTHHYVVGVWKGGWLQSVMLLEYADGQESSLKTHGGSDNVVLLTLMTAPWNLRRRQGWAQSAFLIGLRGLFPGGINVFCKPEKCQPVDYFEKYLGFNRKEGGVLSKKFPPWGELWEKFVNNSYTIKRGEVQHKTNPVVEVEHR